MCLVVGAMFQCHSTARLFASCSLLGLSIVHTLCLFFLFLTHSGIYLPRLKKLQHNSRCNLHAAANLNHISEVFREFSVFVLNCPWNWHNKTFILRPSVATYIACIAIRPITAKSDIIHKTGSTSLITMPPEEDLATATGGPHNKFCEDLSSSSRDMLTDRQTDGQKNLLQYSAPLLGQSNDVYHTLGDCVP